MHALIPCPPLHPTTRPHPGPPCPCPCPSAAVYAVLWISGGHLNPAVSLAALGSGHIDMMRGLLYIAAQVVGALFGAMLAAGITPGERFGRESEGACFEPQGLTGPQLWAWETISTFFFVAGACRRVRNTWHPACVHPSTRQCSYLSLPWFVVWQ